MSSYVTFSLCLVLLIALVCAISSPGPSDAIPPRVALCALVAVGSILFIAWALRRPPPPVSRLCAHCGRSRCVTDLSPLCRACADSLERVTQRLPHVRIPADRSEGSNHG